jgi:2-dehydropantoate 2-reductase
MKEAIEIAHADGAELPRDLWRDLVTSTEKMPAYKTSMLLDYERGQEMEVDAIVTNALKIGTAHRRDCPTVNTIYSILNRNR